MLTAFFDWVIPDSRRVKPACIKNTRNAAIVIHIIDNSSKSESSADNR